MILDDHTLWLKCAEWGSLMRSGDPGACMYGFTGDSGFQSPEHARAVVDYVEQDCVPLAATERYGHGDEDRQDLQNILDTAANYLGGYTNA